MATRTVRPAGGDYTSLSAWEAGRQADITGLGPEIVECSGDLQDTAEVVVDGWTTTADDYIQIITLQVDRHAGVYDATKYRLVMQPTNVSVGALTVRESFVRVAGLQVFCDRTSMTGTTRVIGIYATIASGVGDVRIEQNIIYTNAQPNTGTAMDGSRGIWVEPGQNGAAQTFLTANNIIYGWKRNALDSPAHSVCYGIQRSFRDPMVYVYNNTLRDCDHGFYDGATSANVTARNNVAQDCVVSAFFQCANWVSSFNASDDATHPGTSGQTGEVTFVDEAGSPVNLHLTSGDTVCQGNGTDLSAASPYAITLDIDGQARVAPWDIGADGLVAAISFDRMRAKLRGHLRGVRQ